VLDDKPPATKRPRRCAVLAKNLTAQVSGVLVLVEDAEPITSAYVETLILPGSESARVATERTGGRDALEKDGAGVDCSNSRRAWSSCADSRSRSCQEFLACRSAPTAP